MYYEYQTTALSNDADGIFQDQTTAGADTLTLNGDLVSGGVATAGEAAQIVVEGTGDNDEVNITFVGTDSNGFAISETFLLADNNSATSTLAFKTITEAPTVDAAVDGNIEAGWLSSNPGYTKAFRVNGQHSSLNLGALVDVTGTIDIDLEVCLDPPQSFYANSWVADASWVVYAMDGITADTAKLVDIPCNGVRLKINSGTGTAKLRLLQSNG